MVEQATRFVHCHKLKKNVYIFEDYEVINGVRTLVRCSCPNYTGTASDGRKCDGMNNHNFPCGYANWSAKK